MPHYRPTMLAAALAATLWPLGISRAVHGAPAAPEPAVTGTAGEHRLSSMELRDIMRRFEALVYEQEYTELALDKQRARYAADLAESAATLVETARFIPAVTEQLLTGTAERLEFLALAERLAMEASKLERLAEEKRYREMAAQYDRITGVCANCHSLFRDRTATR